MWWYKNPRRVIGIWVINNFTAHRILNVCIGVSFDSYWHHISNKFARLIDEKEGLEIPFIIMTPILTTIGMYIRLTRFWEAGRLEVVFDIDRKFLKELVIIEGIFAKLIFGKCVGQN